jgi:hypothetical protein
VARSERSPSIFLAAHLVQRRRSVIGIVDILEVKLLWRIVVLWPSTTKTCIDMLYAVVCSPKKGAAACVLSRYLIKRLGK